MKIAILNIFISSFLGSFLLFFSGTISAQPGIPWHHEFGGVEDERANDISFYQDGYVSVGFGASTEIMGDSADSTDILILLLNNLGQLTDYSYIGGSQNENAQACFVSESTLFVAGWTNSSDGDFNENYGSGDMFILSYDLIGGSINWIETIGGIEYDVLYDIIYNDGNVYAVGKSSSSSDDFLNPYGQEDAILVSLNAASGDINYIKNFGGSNDDAFSKIMSSPDGHLFLLGQSRSSDFDVSTNNGSLDVWLVKVDSLGNIIYENSYGGSSADVGKSMYIDNEDAVTVIAESLSDDGDITEVNLGNEDLWFFSVENEQVIVSKLFGGNSGDYPRDIVSTGDGHYVITGGSASFATGSLPGGFALIDQWLLKVDIAGTLVWQRAVGGTDIDFGHTIIADSEKEFTVAGYSDSPDGDFDNRMPHESHDTWVVHFSEDYMVSVPDLELRDEQITIFPNPCTDKCEIHSELYVSQVKIYASNGTLCFTSASDHLDVSSLKQGLYYAEFIFAEGDKKTVKLIKN